MAHKHEHFTNKRLFQFMLRRTFRFKSRNIQLKFTVFQSYDGMESHSVVRMSHMNSSPIVFILCLCFPFGNKSSEIVTFVVVDALFIECEYIDTHIVRFGRLNGIWNTEEKAPRDKIYYILQRIVIRPLFRESRAA